MRLHAGPAMGNPQQQQPVPSGARSRSTPCSTGIIHTASLSSMPPQQQPPLPSSGSKPPWATEEDFAAAAAAQAAAAAAESKRAAARARAAAAAYSTVVEGRRPWQDMEPPSSHLDDGRWGDSGGANLGAEDSTLGSSSWERPSGRLEKAGDGGDFPQHRVSPSVGSGASSASRRPPSAPRDRSRASADTTPASAAAVPRGASGSLQTTGPLRAGRIAATVLDTNLPSGDLGAAEKVGNRVLAAASRRPAGGGMAVSSLLSQQQQGGRGSGSSSGSRGGMAITTAAERPRGSSSCSRVRPPSPSVGRGGGDATPASSTRRPGLEVC